jgi:spore photoproduct lyase
LTRFIPERIYVEEAVQHLPLTRQILKRCAHVPAEYISSTKELIHQFRSKNRNNGAPPKALLLAQNRGRFLEPCPGTKKYLCCGYTILNMGTGCPLDCSYCVLQAYLNNPFITLYVNLDDMWHELASSPHFKSKTVARIGTGEYGDSLALEHITDFVPEFASFLKSQKTAILELKTKTTAIEPLCGLDHGGRIIVSWSLNAQEVAQAEEQASATVVERIKAAQRLVKEGYRIGFHFDPLILYQGWEQKYQRVVDLIAGHIPPASIAWVSMGALRFMPGLKAISMARFSNTKIFAEEFIMGLDGKMRYFQPLRIELFARMAEWLRQYAPDIFIYLCMESPIVWKQSLGFAPESNAELKKMLDDRINW